MSLEHTVGGKRSRLQPNAVLADCYDPEIQQTTVFVTSISDEKATSRLVTLLSKEFPLNDLHHLKRVRSGGEALEIILCTNEEDLPSASAVEGIDRSKIKKQQVASNAPLTRCQYEASSVLWPTQFHENKEIERTLDGSFFNATELNKIESFMRTAIEISIEAGQVDANVALVVNPASNSILAIGSSRVGDHPVLHATMVALDLVARLQGGGAWETGLPIQQVGEDEQVPPNATTPYICTGYDVYILREPCAMCSMALVHSRVRRTFYGVSDPKRGSLGSRFKIHCLGGLNHSFKVWRNILADECQRALDRAAVESL